jgi:hypothetical protein
MSQCAACGDKSPVMSQDLPQGIALEILRRNMLVTTDGVSKIVEESSVKIWSWEEKPRRDLFEQQIDLLSSLYVIMRSSKKQEE